MSQARILGGAFYNNPEFKALMNGLYYPLENMKSSVAKLKASGQIDIETMEYGQYQPILAPRDRWPHGGGNAWLREMGRARVELSAARPITGPRPGGLGHLDAAVTGDVWGHSRAANTCRYADLPSRDGWH